jgi:uncharacterized membrane protein
MNDIENVSKSNAVAKLPLLAAVVALGGIGDAIYLTHHHYNKVLVPCGEGFDCGAVLSSQYAEIAGIPLAAFGVAAYFIAFILATLAALGNRKLWILFGVQVTLMTLASAYFVYLQAFVIQAYCQFCLISAGVCLTLFIIALASKFWKK